MENLIDLKIMAQFMGIEFIKSISPYTITESNWLSEKDLVSTYKFDREWDWLMKVVEKIEDIKEGKLCLYEINIFGNKCFIEGRNIESIDVVEKTKIEAVFMACLLFIDWYTRETSDEALELIKYGHLLPVEVDSIFKELCNELINESEYPTLSEYLERVEELGFRFNFDLNGMLFNICSLDYFEELKDMFKQDVLINPKGEPLNSSIESKADAALTLGYFKYKTGIVHKITLNDLLGK